MESGTRVTSMRIVFILVKVLPVLLSTYNSTNGQNSVQTYLAQGLFIRIASPL